MSLFFLSSLYELVPYLMWILVTCVGGAHTHAQRVKEKWHMCVFGCCPSVVGDFTMCMYRYMHVFMYCTQNFHLLQMKASTKSKHMS